MPGKPEPGWLRSTAATSQVAFSGGSLRSTWAAQHVVAAFRIVTQSLSQDPSPPAPLPASRARGGEDVLG
jgi:hypothetical protein